MKFASRKVKLTGPRTPSSTTDEWYKIKKQVWSTAIADMSSVQQKARASFQYLSHILSWSIERLYWAKN